MENVFGLAYRNQSRPFFDRLRAGIQEAGYSLSYGSSTPPTTGFPRTVRRLLVIGAREGGGNWSCPRDALG